MNFYEESNPPDMPLSHIMNLIKPHFTSIKEKEVKFLYHGSYNVYEIREKFIFRFPDKVFFNENGLDLIQREQKLLELIRENISLQIPKPLYVSSDPTNPFIGYKKINGISLSRCYHKTNLDDQKNITKQLGEFLSELHSRNVYQKVCTAWKSEQGFNPSYYHRYWQDYLKRVKEKAYPLLSSEQKQWVSQFFLNFLKVEKNFDFVPRVVHGDFDITNILVDPVTFEVIGIIDFEETGVYDPAADFLFYNEGKLFLSHLLSHYTGVKDCNIQNRMKFLYCRSGLIYILTALDYNIPKMVDYGLHLIRERMKRFPS